MRFFSAASACAAILAANSLTGCSGDHSSAQATGSGGSTSTTTATGGEGTGGATAFMPGPHGALPRMVNLGGPAVAAPKVQLIAWASDPVATDVDKMITELGTTSTWAAQTQE